jgi:hypothetical protein
LVLGMPFGIAMVVVAIDYLALIVGQDGILQPVGNRHICA